MRLRQLCQEGQCTVRAATPSGRDAMFRQGVQAAIQAAASGRTVAIGGSKPARLVAGLAKDLEVPDEDARRISVAEVSVVP